MTGKLGDLEKELSVMAKFKIDANEWYLLRCLFIAKFENDNSYLIKYIKECSKEGITAELLQSLKSKNILDKKYKVPQKGETFSLEELDFHQPFINKYLRSSNEMGQELFDAYPSYLIMDNGKHLPARNLVSKVVFKSMNDFFILYCKQIKYSVEKHEEIMSALTWAKEKNMINSSIVEYVISKKYDDHINSMKQDKQGKFVNKNDILEVV